MTETAKVIALKQLLDEAIKPGDPGWDVPEPGDAEPAPKRAVRTKRLPRHEGLWAAVSLKILKSRRWDGYFPAPTRLLIYLQIVSYQGEQPVRLTNTMVADELGLNRSQKFKALRRLVADGLVTTASKGREVIVVHVKPWTA